MSYESRAYDERHADDTGTPVVVLVVKGTRDVSRLVGLFAGGPATIEQLQAGRRFRAQLNGHNFGRAAIELLAAHGGPDFTPSRAEALIEEHLAKVRESLRVAPPGHAYVNGANRCECGEPLTTIADHIKHHASLVAGAPPEVARG